MSQEKEEFSENIIQDVAALGITYEKLTHTSDYFPEMLDLAERLIKKGYIYADDTPLEQMREVMHTTPDGRNDPTYLVYFVVCDFRFYIFYISYVFYILFIIYML